MVAAAAASGAGYDLHHAFTKTPQATARAAVLRAEKPALQHAGKPALRHAARTPAVSVSLPALVRDRPEHASAAALSSSHGRALGRTRHAVPRQRALGQSAGSAASAVARSRRSARGAVASAQPGPPLWARSATPTQPPPPQAARETGTGTAQVPGRNGVLNRRTCPCPLSGAARRPPSCAPVESRRLSGGSRVFGAGVFG